MIDRDRSIKKKTYLSYIINYYTCLCAFVCGELIVRIQTLLILNKLYYLKKKLNHFQKNNY